VAKLLSEAAIAYAFQRADEDAMREYMAGFVDGEREYVATLMRNVRVALGPSAAWFAFVLDANRERTLGADAAVVFVMDSGKSAKVLLLEAKRLVGAWDKPVSRGGTVVEPSHFTSQLRRQAAAAPAFECQEFFIRPRAQVVAGLYARCATLVPRDHCLAQAKNVAGAWTTTDVVAAANRGASALGQIAYDLAACMRGKLLPVSRTTSGFRLVGQDLPELPWPAPLESPVEAPAESGVAEWMRHVGLGCLGVVDASQVRDLGSFGRCGDSCIMCALEGCACSHAWRRG